MKANGKLSINIYGIFFFEKNNFEMPNFHYKLHEIRQILIQSDFLQLDFVVEHEKKLFPYSTKLLSLNMQDIAYDLVSYMIVSMREPKKMFYAYNYLSGFINNMSTRQGMSPYDKASEPLIIKCNEEIAKLRNIVL